MSDVKCARMLFRAPERDITALRIIRVPSEHTPYVVEFRYQGVGPDGEPIDHVDPLVVVQTGLKQMGKHLAEVEGA